jgi:hypothetical protein
MSFPEAGEGLPPVPLSLSPLSPPDAANEPSKAKLVPVPDQNGMRFCRVCNKFLPIGMFPIGQRRYTCRPHIWKKIGKKSKMRLHQKPEKKLLSQMWVQCYKDSRMLRVDIHMKQKDISMMLQGIQENERGGLCVLPKDPLSPISPENSALVTKNNRRVMLSEWKKANKVLQAFQETGQVDGVGSQEQEMKADWQGKMEEALLD